MSDEVRVSQNKVELGHTLDKKIRVSQSLVESGYSIDSEELRVSMNTVEVGFLFLVPTGRRRVIIT